MKYNILISIFKDALDAINPDSKKPVLIYDQQSIGTIETMLSSVVKDTFEAIKKANEIKREPAPLSKLRIGLECGGSDGFSGISANPALGHVSDIMAALGGKSILAEFPELCGVEQELVNRCVEEEKANLKKELEYTQGFLASVMKKLSNERFVAGAPAQVIEMERKKQADAEAKIKALEESLAKLG